MKKVTQHEFSGPKSGSRVCSPELLEQGRSNNWGDALVRLLTEAWPRINPSFQISSGATIFTIGSCFARNIEDHLKLLGYSVPTLDYRAPRVVDFNIYPVKMSEFSLKIHINFSAEQVVNDP